MKKLLGIVVLGLLWCNVGFGETKKATWPSLKNLNKFRLNLVFDVRIDPAIASDEDTYSLCGFNEYEVESAIKNTISSSSDIKLSSDEDSEILFIHVIAQSIYGKHIINRAPGYENIPYQYAYVGRMSCSVSATLMTVNKDFHMSYWDHDLISGLTYGLRSGLKSRMKKRINYPNRIENFILKFIKHWEEAQL